MDQHRRPCWTASAGAGVSASAGFDAGAGLLVTISLNVAANSLVMNGSKHRQPRKPQAP